MHASLLVALLLAANASGKTLVRQNPGTTVVPPPTSKLFTDDAGTVFHGWWDGTALRDTKAAGFAMQGTVPQVARSGRTPPGAGPYSDANNYKLDPLGTGSDVLDFTGDFSLCVAFTGPTTGSYVLVSDGTLNVDGWYVIVQVGTASLILNRSGALNNVAASGSVIATAVNVLCVGRTGTTGYAKLNGGVISAPSNGATIVTATTTPAYLGRYSGTGVSFGTGTIYEVWASTTTPTDALFTSIMAQARARAGITAW